MQRQQRRETNPHFLPSQLPTLELETPEPPHGPIHYPPQRRRHARPRGPIPNPPQPRRHAGPNEPIRNPPQPWQHAGPSGPIHNPPQTQQHTGPSGPISSPPQPRWHTGVIPTPPPPSDHPDSSHVPTPPPHQPPGSSALPPGTDFVQRHPQSRPEDDYIDFTPQRHHQPKVQPTTPPLRRGGRHHDGQPPPPPQHHHPSSLRMPSRTKTNPFAWLIAACCTLFWILVIFALLAILVIYLVFRPRNPKFDISSATLNAAYLDMGYLLNGDVTLLANFTNPNKKGRVEFHYAVVDLYHNRTPIASTYIQPFSMMNHEYKFQEVHLVSSQVGLSSDHSQQLRNQIESGKVRFELRGLFRVKSDLGGILKYSYWLYSHCIVMVTSPPTGTLIAKRCSTKR